jgi:hypothetical protein
MKTLTALLAGLTAATLSINAQTTTGTATTTTTQTTRTTTTPNPPPGHPIAGYVANDMKWIDAPPSLPGAQMVVLQGDPSKAGPYTMRLRFPAGYRVPLNSHDQEISLTIISGLLHVGIAPTFDQSNSKDLGALSFAVIPAKMKHTAWCDIETIVQVSGIGPWNMQEAYPSTVGAR